jgi:hypothetical protein
MSTTTPASTVHTMGDGVARGPTHHRAEVQRDAARGTWWFLRAYPGSSAALDAAVAAIVPWARAQAVGLAASRWFFIRYVDESGPHVRLRVRLDPDAADALHSRRSEVDELLSAIAPGASPADGGPLVRPRSEAEHRPGPRGSRAGVYAPEHAKYGGAAGVRLAEHVFHDASELILDTGACRLPRRYDRAALAAELARQLLDATVRADQQLLFWEQHWRWWGSHLAFCDIESPEAARAEVTAGLARTAVTADVHARIAAHVRTVVRHLAAAQRLPDSPATSTLVFHHLHMSMNRLGLHPPDEALVGAAVAAAALRKENR